MERKSQKKLITGTFLRLTFSNILTYRCRLHLRADR